MNELRAKRLQIKERRQKFGPMLAEVQRCDWPLALQNHEGSPVRAWESRDFLAQLRIDPYPVLSFCRKELNADGGWKDNISWDDLHRLKSEAGYGHVWAVECHPPDDSVVNLANFRHLWLLPKPPPYGWHRK